MTQPFSETEAGSCGHASFCAPKNDGQCDHLNGQVWLGEAVALKVRP